MTMASSSADRAGDESNEPYFHPVWRKLPTELVEVVLKRVPFESLVRFRAVCKRFNFLITCPKFVRECQTQQAWLPLPVIAHYEIGADSNSIEIFHSEKNKWLMHPLPILEANLYPLELTAATGGLLCFDTKDYRKTVVCNPLTGAFRLLACPDSPRCPDGNDGLSFWNLSHRLFTGLVVDLQAGTFTLVVVNVTKGESTGKTFLYDSAVGSWILSAPLHDVDDFGNGSLTLTSNESIYGVAICSMGTFKLVKYDVRNDNWSKISVASGPQECLENRVEITEHRRQVVVVSTAISERSPPDKRADFAKTFYTVRKAATGHVETLVEEGVVRGVWPEMLRETEPRNVESLFHGWADNFGDFFTTEIGDEIRITRCADLFIETQHLNRAMQVLPKAWPRSYFQVKLLEPSFTV